MNQTKTTRAGAQAITELTRQRDLLLEACKAALADNRKQVDGSLAVQEQLLNAIAATTEGRAA